MSISGTQVETKNGNVLPLFDGLEIPEPDPLEVLLEEAKDLSLEHPALKNFKERKLVSPDQFPDQSIYILEDQLKSLKTSIQRIKFYLGDLDDLLPR